VISAWNGFKKSSDSLVEQGPPLKSSLCFWCGLLRQLSIATVQSETARRSQGRMFCWTPTRKHSLTAEIDSENE